MTGGELLTLVLKENQVYDFNEKEDDFKLDIALDTRQKALRIIIS